MRKLVIALCGAAAVAVPAWAATRSFTVTGFEKVASAGSFDVIVTTGKGVSVRAEGEEKALDRLEIKVEDRTLKIGTKSRSWSWGDSDMDKVRVYVTAPAITGAALAGSGDMRIDRLTGADAKLRVAGSGDLTVANVNAGAVGVSVAGSGNVAAVGKCTSVAVSVAGSGDVTMPDLKCETITAKVAGSGNVSGYATKAGTVSVAGSGDVRIGGGAKCKVSKVGSGDVVCG
jgi:hypothetical protein